VFPKIWILRISFRIDIPKWKINSKIGNSQLKKKNILEWNAGMERCFPE